MLDDHHRESRACSANAAARAWCRAATTSRSHRGDSVERHFMDTIEGGKWLPHQELAWTLVIDRGRAHPRAGERARLLLRSQSRRHAAPEGVRRPDLRPHRAQGRSHRHRDHQPAGGAGVGAPASAASKSIARVELIPAQGRRRDRRRADDRHAHRRVPFRRRRRPCCSRPAAGRRCTATTRRPATRAATAWRWRCAPACRCATWRWCSSIRPGCSPGRTRA